jgi:signal transduction histidine kinase
MAERRAQLEAHLRRQDRLAALGKVVAGVAHEIRNPLNSIRLSLELLQRRVNKGTATGEEVTGAMEEVDRLDHILARLLAFGRPDFEDRRAQDVRPILERAARMVQQQAQAKGVRLIADGGDISADIDAGEVEQVLINLLLNAIDASPPGAEVRIDTALARNSVRIAVHDEGPGVEQAARDHIFDPYFTTKQSGNGLGLAVSREVAARHGGSLELLPQNGHGSTFVLELPVERETS